MQYGNVIILTVKQSDVDLYYLFPVTVVAYCNLSFLTWTLKNFLF